MKLQFLPDIELIQIFPQNNIELRGIKSYFNRYVDGYYFDPLYKNKLWDGKRSHFKTDKESETHYIPMGLWKEAFKCCEEFKYPFEFINKKDFPLNREIKKEEFEEFVKEFFSDYKFQPYEHQVRCAFNILKNKYCNISVATGGGKTLIFSLVLLYLLQKYPNKKFLLVVPSKTLVVQFYDEIIDYYHNKQKINIQEIFDESEDPRITYENEPINLVIGTFQSLSGKDEKTNKYKYDKKWFQQFFMITGDEMHKAKAQSYKYIFKNTFNNAEYRWGMTGTFYDESTYEMAEIMAKSGPVVDKITAKELMDLGILTPVKIKQIHLYHNDFEFTEQIEVVAGRDGKTAYDLECAKIQESEERLNFIVNLVSKCKTNTLVLFHNVEYGQKILEKCKEKITDKDFHYIDGSVKQKRTKKNEGLNRADIKESMNITDKVQVIIGGFGVLSTGWSSSNIHNIIFTQSFKKEQVIIQSIGRALRLHESKEKAYIFDLVDVFDYDNFAFKTKSKFKNKLRKHGEERAKIYIEHEYQCDTMEVQLKSIDF